MLEELNNSPDSLNLELPNFEEYKTALFAEPNIRHSAYFGDFSEWTRDEYSEANIHVGYNKFNEWLANYHATSGKELSHITNRRYLLLHSIEAAHLNHIMSLKERTSQ